MRNPAADSEQPIMGTSDGESMTHELYRMPAGAIGHVAELVENEQAWTAPFADSEAAREMAAENAPRGRLARPARPARRAR